MCLVGRILFTVRWCVATRVQKMKCKSARVNYFSGGGWSPPDKCYLIKYYLRASIVFRGVIQTSTKHEVVQTLPANQLITCGACFSQPTILDVLRCSQGRQYLGTQIRNCVTPE